MRGLVVAVHLATAAALHVAPRCAAPRATVAATALSTFEAAKIFCRMADATLYLDGAVGACCHSACSDCEWRLPDGGYRFDIMSSTRRKWVPCYLARDFGDERGCHVPRWAKALFPDGEASPALTRAQFGAAMIGLDFEMASARAPANAARTSPRLREPLRASPPSSHRAVRIGAAVGPRGNIAAGADEPEADAIEALWAYLSDGAEELAPMAAVRRLQDLSPDEDRAGAIGEGPDSLDWKAFAKGLGVAPFEKW